MQYALNIDAEIRSNPIVVADYLLRKSIDLAPVTYRFDPVTQLVKAMLGVRTRGEESVEALRILRQRFPDWEELCAARFDDVVGLIRQVNYAEDKASNLIASMRQIRVDRGALDLSHLADMSVPQALLWLERLPGIGRKVSASVLNASNLHRRALVIDTHHLRVLKRLGLVGMKHDYRAAYDRIMPQIPPSWCPTRIDDHHRMVKRLGQTTCQHFYRHCARCPLRTVCASVSVAASGWAYRNSSPVNSPRRAVRG